MKLAEALDERTSLRRVCGFSNTEPRPERTAFVRFGKAVVTAKLDCTLFETLTLQLKAKALGVKPGPSVDAPLRPQRRSPRPLGQAQGQASRSRVQGPGGS